MALKKDAWAALSCVFQENNTPGIEEDIPDEPSNLLLQSPGRLTEPKMVIINCYLKPVSLS